MATIEEQLIREVGSKVDRVLELLKTQVPVVCPRCEGIVRHKGMNKLERGVTTVHCPHCQGYFEIEVRRGWG